MNLDKRYTAEQVTIAAKELRDAAGAGDAQQKEVARTGNTYFSGHQVVSMLSDEIRMLHERGFSNGKIADLLQGFDIEADAEDIEASSDEGLG